MIRPISGEELSGRVQAVIPTAVVGSDESTVWITPESVLDVCRLLADTQDLEFNLLNSISAVDYIEHFELVYHLTSTSRMHSAVLKTRIFDRDAPALPSVFSVWQGADFQEREVWDLFGVMFSGHPDLRRILTDYGFEGHPLRKDFPLTGFVEMRYDDEKKRVVYEPVKLTQVYRSFDFLSPWEGMQAQLPGDEKAEEQADGDA